MRPVLQRIVDPQRGDCYRAAVASVLDRDLDAVPADIGSGFVEGAWLKEQGLCAVHLDAHRLAPRPDGYAGRTWDARNLVRFDFAVGAIAVASVPSQMFAGGWHAIVVGFVEQPEGWVRVECLHDPNPGNARYDMEATMIRALTFYMRSPLALAAVVDAMGLA